MKICLANFPWEDLGKWGIRAGCRFPNLMPRRHNSYVPFPFLLAYAASYLESRGIEVLLIDGVAERCGRESFLSRVTEFAPDMVVAETATTSFEYDVSVMAAIKHDNPATRTVMYGPHISALPKGSMAHQAIDFGILGEPEFTTYELARAVEHRESVEQILGLAYRTPSGEVRVNPRRPQIDPIDDLPYPKRTGFPIDRYSVPGFPAPVMFVYASRGCPFQCTFCLWPQTIFERGTYRPRSSAAIVEEMIFLREHFAARSFFFDDDTFNLGRTRILEFADEMKIRAVKMPWGMNARADHLDREMLERLIETGLFTLRMGIESGDQGVLDATRKGLDLEKTRRALELSHSLGISNHVSFMVGLAGETPQSIQNTARYIKSIPVDSVQFSVATPFPGTELHQFVQDRGFLVSTNWKRYNGSDSAVLRTESMTAEEICDAIAMLRRGVYLSPRFMRRRLSYVRNVRDVIALSGKLSRLLLPRSARERANSTEA